MEDEEAFIKKKLNFWLRGVYITAPLEPYGKAKKSGLNVFYLPHQRISCSIPFCIISNKDRLPAFWTEELIRCTLVPVTTCYGEKGVRIYLHFTGLKPRDRVRRKAVITWTYEKCMSSTYRRTGELYIPTPQDLVVFQGVNGGRFCYTYSIFITERNIEEEEADMQETFIHHGGNAGALARHGVSVSNETSGCGLKTPAQKVLEK